MSFSNNANNQITDLDLTISLSDGICTTCTCTENNDYANGIKLISETMNERLDMLKTRESLVHGFNTGTYADWFRARPRCFLSLDNSDDAEKFKRYSLKLSESIVKKEANANKIRADTIRLIGFATEESAAMRKKLDDEILKAKSRKYQGVFEVKSRVKTWQVRGIWSQQ